MVRTQIYLTDQERSELAIVAEAEGKAQSTLIREAIDQFLENKRQNQLDREQILQAAKGLWARHKNLPDLKKLRSEFDRFGEK